MRTSPLRRYAGCRDVGFKQTAQYFIDCIKMTSIDDVPDIKEWKENLQIVEDVLLNTPTITPRYNSVDDMDKFLKDLEEDLKERPTPDKEDHESVTKKWFFDVQTPNCPEFVKDEVIDLWQEYDLGNDNYIFYIHSFGVNIFEEYPKIYFWLKHKGVKDGDEVIIYYWW